MKPAIAAAAQSFPGRGSIVWLLRVDRLIGLANKLSGFAVLLLVWQIALLLALLDGMIDFGAYAGIHCFGCAGLAAYLVWCLKASASGDRYCVALQIVAWSAVAGPFGAFVAAALSLPAAPVSAKVLRDVDIDSRTVDSASEQTELLHISLLDRRVRSEGACLVRPLMDVIAEGSQPEKLEALGVIYRKYEARLNVVLKRALQDSDTSVRVLAATVTAKLHATYSRKIGEFQTAAAAEPELPQHLRDLAEVRLQYAASGLPETSRARAQIELAVGDLSRAVELDPADRASADCFDRARRQLAEWGR